MHIRYVVGTNRRKLLTGMRRLRGRLRRVPSCAKAVPRPRPTWSRAGALRLTHVILASDLHPSYVGLWPIARHAWNQIAGLEPVLVLVADPSHVPPELANDPNVHVFEPEIGLHTAFQAQCIRLLYPALMDTPGAILTSDIDMVPMSSRYFHRPLVHVDRHQFVCYRDVLLDLGELPICYNAALSQTWASIFEVGSIEDVRRRLREWSEGVAYAGTHGGAGWTTDQRWLYRILLDRGRSRRDVWILDDAFTGYRRLERAYVEKWDAISPDARRGIARRAFSDFHLLRADGKHAALNTAVVDAAIQAARP